MNEGLLKVSNLLNEDRYISKKEYLKFLKSLNSEYIANIELKVQRHNNQFINRKLIEYNNYFRYRAKKLCFS